MAFSGNRRQTLLTPAQLLWDLQPIRHIRLIDRLSTADQVNHLSLQLRLDLGRALAVSPTGC